MPIVLIDNPGTQNVTPMDKEVAHVYGNRVRVRVCGLCWQDDRLLMVNYRGITDAAFWAPPGGGVEFGQSIEQTLRREFLEETGLEIRPGPFLFGCEFIQAPLHAIELFYPVIIESGTLRRGSDPELNLIEDVRFMTLAELLALGANEIHGIFRGLKSPDDLMRLKGFFRI